MATPMPPRSAWVMLLALVAGFALSQAFRTTTAIMAAGLQTEFALTPQALGIFAGVFAFAFGAMQVFMGVGIDLFGVRRTVLTVFPLTIAGSLLSAWATQWTWVLLGQVLIGIGCAPAFLVCTVFIARYFAVQRFALVSGLALGLGGLGMLLTGTPLAWVVEQWSWRAGFLVLAGLAGVAWFMIFWRVHEPPRPADAAPQESFSRAMRGFGALFLLPHTLGIMLLGLVTYAAFLALRGLWLGPLLMERHGFSLLQSGNVALLVSFVSLVGPVVFGRLDPGPKHRRRSIVGCTLLLAGLFVAMAVLGSAWMDVGGACAIALLSGYIVWQYADVRAAYPAAMTGRAMAVFTMAMFLGVALVQWFTGWVASVAPAQGLNVHFAVLLSIALLLSAGAMAFRWLPAPRP